MIEALPPPQLWLPPKPAIIRPWGRASFLPGMFPAGAVAAAVGAPLPTVEEFSEQSSGASQDSYTFSGVTLSEAGLLVVRFMVGGTFNANRTAGSVTVGGNAASIIQQGASGVVGLGSAAAGLAVIEHGAGATGDIVIGIASGLNAASVAIHPLAIRGLVSTTPFHGNSAGVTSATSVSTTLNVPADGIQVVSASSIQGAQSHTPTGFTDSPAGGSQIDTSWRFHRGYDIGLAPETGRTLTSASASAEDRAIAAASWA